MALSQKLEFDHCTFVAKGTGATISVLLADGFKFSVPNTHVLEGSDFAYASRIGTTGKLVVDRKWFVDTQSDRYSSYVRWKPPGLDAGLLLSKPVPERDMESGSLYTVPRKIDCVDGLRLEIEMPYDGDDHPNQKVFFELVRYLDKIRANDVLCVVLMQYLTGMYAEEVCGLTSDPLSYRGDGPESYLGTRQGDLYWLRFPGFIGQLFLTARYCNAPWRVVPIPTQFEKHLRYRWNMLGGLRCHPGCHFTLCTMERYKEVMLGDGMPIWANLSGGSLWYHYNSLSTAQRKNQYKRLAFNQPGDMDPHKSQYQLIDIDFLEENAVPYERFRGVVMIYQGYKEFGIGYYDTERWGGSTRTHKLWCLRHMLQQKEKWDQYSQMRVHAARHECIDHLPSVFANTYDPSTDSRKMNDAYNLRSPDDVVPSFEDLNVRNWTKELAKVQVQEE